MCNSILCHIIKLPHICLYPDDSARQLFFFCTTFHILREILHFVKVFLSFFIWILHEFILFFYIDFVIFFIIQFLYLHCQKSFCFYIAVSATFFRFPPDLQLHDGRLMSHCRNNLLYQIFCPKSETRCIDAWMASDIFSLKHLFIDQKPYHPVLIIHKTKHT